jgi:hypothetical protein
VSNAAPQAAAPAGAAPGAAGANNAGEAVVSDRKAGAIQRARELGLKDGKAGNKAHFDELKAWPEEVNSGLSEMDPASRQAFFYAARSVLQRRLDRVRHRGARQSKPLRRLRAVAVCPGREHPGDTRYNRGPRSSFDWWLIRRDRGEPLILEHDHE